MGTFQYFLLYIWPDPGKIIDKIEAFVADFILLSLIDWVKPDNDKNKRMYKIIFFNYKSSWDKIKCKSSFESNGISILPFPLFETFSLTSLPIL